MSKEIYRGHKTMGAERGQKLWDIEQGRERYEDKVAEILAKREKHQRMVDQFTGKMGFEMFGDFIPPSPQKEGVRLASYGLSAVGEQWGQKKYVLPEYEEDVSFWGQSRIEDIAKGSEKFIEETDKSLGESLAFAIEDYAGGLSAEDFTMGRDFLSPGWDTSSSPPSPSQDTPSKAQGGGLIQANGGSVPTIADYFSMQGKTLDGSHKQSLAEKLGRT